MVLPSPSRWTVRGVTFLLWLAAGASVVHWGLKLAARPVAATAPTVARGPAAVDPVAVTRLLGSGPAPAAPAAPSLASRFALVGVVAGPGAQPGAALIVVDGKPAKPYRVGAAIEEGIVLQSVEARRAVLAAAPDAPPLLALDLPPRSAAASQSPAMAGGMPPGIAPGMPRPALQQPGQPVPGQVQLTP
jgi:general secretion pathway protein C